MTAEMDLAGDKKMDWFFNQYVYGTALPSYKLDYTFENGADGVLSFNFTVPSPMWTTTFVCWSRYIWNWRTAAS